MRINDVKDVLQPYFEKNLVRIIYDNSEVTILNVAEREYVSIYKKTAGDKLWGLLIPKEDLMDAAKAPYEMLQRYSIQYSCKDQIILFQEEYLEKASGWKESAEDSEEIDPEIEGQLQDLMKDEDYDHSQNLENDKSAAPGEKTLRKCMVVEKVDDTMVKNDLHLNDLGLKRSIILWLVVAVCLYQFSNWIPSLETILEILSTVCIIKAGTDLFLYPKRKKEGSKAKIRVQYHTCLKKFSMEDAAGQKLYILMDNWDVFEVTNISNSQVLWEGDQVGYVFVDGRMVKDFFYILDYKKD